MSANEIKLDPEQKKQIAFLAATTGKPWELVLREALEQYQVTAPQQAPDSSTQPVTVTSRGALSHLKVRVSVQDIKDARSEMWQNFPREITGVEGDCFGTRRFIVFGVWPANARETTSAPPCSYA
jgi:hypothetical protein